jgi:Family of unknown function (DUF6445)
VLNRYYIVDDFFKYPQQVAESALESVIEPASGQKYAGTMSSEVFLGEEQRDFFQQLTLEPSINSSTNLNGRVRFTMEQDPYLQYIHFDGFIKTRWAGVIYLSEDHPVVDGTAFWRHRRTGLEEMPRELEDLKKHGWDKPEGIRNLLEVDGIDESAWEKTLVVPYRFNRLVLFRPWMFHGPGPAFGDTLATSRKVLTLFLGN